MLFLIQGEGVLDPGGCCFISQGDGVLDRLGTRLTMFCQIMGVRSMILRSGECT